MKCPICGKENRSQPFKTWNYGVYQVSRYRCSECGEAFNTYVGEKQSFTIPKRTELSSAED